MIPEATFFGEFGLDCWPVMESIRKFTPESELLALEALPAADWAIPDDSVLAHHTPMFNKAGDLARQQRHVSLFLTCDSVENSVIGSQLAQVVTVRHTLERARTRWPFCTGAIMYKLNDPYPAASWSTVDWYGAQKPASFFVADAFAPLTAVVILDKLNYIGEEVALPVYLLNDTAEDCDAVEIRIYDKALSVVRTVNTPVSDPTRTVTALPHLKLSASETASAPLFLAVDVLKDGRLCRRSWYFLNFETEVGCLFTLPKTSLRMTKTDRAVTLTNCGDKPAVCVSFDAPSVCDRFRPDDSCLWLDPGESVTVGCNFTDGIDGPTCWNLDPDRL